MNSCSCTLFLVRKLRFWMFVNSALPPWLRMLLMLHFPLLRDPHGRLSVTIPRRGKVRAVLALDVAADSRVGLEMPSPRKGENETNARDHLLKIRGKDRFRFPVAQLRRRGPTARRTKHPAARASLRAWGATAPGPTRGQLSRRLGVLIAKDAESGVSRGPRNNFQTNSRRLARPVPPARLSPSAA